MQKLTQIKGMQEKPTLSEVQLDDEDSVQIVSNLKIKKLVVKKCPRLTKFVEEGFEEVELLCLCSDQFMN